MKYLFIIFFLIITNVANSTICISTGNSNWNNVSSWSCGQIPINLDTVIIQPGHTITINTNMYNGGGSPTLIITVNGHLYFDGGKLNLSTSSNITIPSSGLISANGSCSCSQIAIGTGGAEWSGSSGPLSSAVLTDGSNVPLSMIWIVYEKPETDNFIKIYTDKYTLGVIKDYYDVYIYDITGHLIFQTSTDKDMKINLNQVCIMILSNKNEIKRYKIY